MGLQSQLFQGDPRLEACLTQDSAHVTQGAAGPHVAKIQAALAVLDGALISDGEVAAQSYGRTTASAVLAYKTKRGIVNRSYQSQADNIVGKMTIAALDKEMAAHENEPSPCETCRMNLNGGDVDPAGPPAPGGGASVAFAIAAPVGQAQIGQAPVGQALTARDAALQAVPLATQWTTLGALSEIDTMLALIFVSDLAKNNSLPFPSLFDAINTHFHLDRDPKHLRRNLTRLRTVFGRIQTVLAGASGFFRNGPATPKSPFADAPMGGFQLPGTQFNHITFRPGFLTCGPNTRAAMIIHEGAHFVGGLNFINHFATEFPAPQGKAQGKGHTRNYRDLHTDEALRNAASYAAYAIHAATSTDSRFGAANIAL